MRHHFMPWPMHKAIPPEAPARLLRAADAGPDDVLAADGCLFATPENLAAMAGMMKDFFDRCYDAALQIERIATGWRMAPPRPRPD